MAPARSRGRLIALEGIDGSGKSSLRRSLLRRLRRSGWSVAAWREPTRRSLGRTGQEIAGDDPAGAAVHFTLDRMLSRPRLERLLAHHDLVVTDRSFYSTLAYQGSALPSEARNSLTALQRRIALEPDRVVWLSIPVEVALARVGRRGSRRAPLEQRKTLRRVATAYRELARAPDWWTLDARRPTAELAAEVERRLRRTWPPRESPPRRAR